MNDDEARARYPKVTQQSAAAAEAAQKANPADRLREPPGDVLAKQGDAANAGKPRLKHVGGSDDDAFNLALTNATLSTAWITDRTDQDRAIKFIGKALAGIGPKDECEGLLAGQMVAMHMASLECSRRAMIPEQSVDARTMNLKAAARASQTYAQLLGALDKHRGKGRQTVRVEHVHVAPGAQAIVGNVEAAGGRAGAENSRKPHEPIALAHASEPPLRCQNEARELVSVSGDDEREMQTPRRKEPRSASR